LDYIQYCTYFDKHKKKISNKKAFAGINVIYSEYSKNLIMLFISSLMGNIGVENSPVTLIKIHEHYLGEKTDNVIHRRAIHLLSQIFFSCTNFSKFDYAYKISHEDTYNLFLFANTILNGVEGYKKLSEDEIPSSIQFFHTAYRFSNDLITNQDVRILFLFYHRFYEKLRTTKSKNQYDIIIKNTVGINLEIYSDILNQLYNRKKKIAYNFVIKNFSVLFEDTNKKWLTRKPKIKIPFEYRFLQTNSIVIYEFRPYWMCSIPFIFAAMAKKPYHIFRGSGNLNFGNDFGNSVENTFCEFFDEKLLNRNCLKISELKIRNVELADYGILYKNNLLLFEIKSSMLSLKEKYEQNLGKFQNAIDDKYVNSSGVTQQLKRIKNLDEYYELFCKKNNLSNSIPYNIIPIILFLDEEFIALGVNKYFGERFISKRSELEYEFKKINCHKNNTALTFNELYSSIEELQNPEDVLKSIILYNINFNNINISMFPYENYLQKEYNKQKNIL